MKKLNCWEFKQCGRGPAGKNDCPAARDNTLNGVHGGINAGRACWVAAGTSSESGPSGTFAKQIGVCFRCEFFRLVETEEQRSESGLSATKLGMLKMLENKQPARSAPMSQEDVQFDAHLRNEFAQEVNKLMSEENDADKDLRAEFAKEVERLNSERRKDGT